MKKIQRFFSYIFAYVAFYVFRMFRHIPERGIELLEKEYIPYWESKKRFRVIKLAKKILNENKRSARERAD